VGHKADALRDYGQKAPVFGLGCRPRMGLIGQTHQLTARLSLLSSLVMTRMRL